MEQPDDEVARARAELADWGEPVLNPLDALMWRTERPPGDSWSGVVAMLLDGQPDWKVVRKAHLWGVRVVPRFAEKVVEPLLPTGPPMWAPDEDFDIDRHLHRERLPEPGGMAELLEVARRLALTALDKTRPPWSAIYVEGLEGGRSAYLLQAHHVLMDGAAATQLLSRLLDRAPGQAATPADAVRRPKVSRAAVTAQGVAWQARGVGKLVRGSAARLAAAVSRPQSSARRAMEFAESLPRVATPPPPADSALLTPGPRTNWRFATFECEVTDLKRAAKAAGGTVNDAFVSAVLGGLRTYHDRHGERLGDVPISMPVSMRRADDPMGGNRFAGAFFSVPSGVADPTERIQEMHARVERVRAEPALDFMGLVTPLMNLAPAEVVAAAIQQLNAGATLTTSSWLGLPHATYLAGARVERMFVFGPLPGTSMCAALCTHEGTCCIGVNVDGDVFPDLELFWDCLRQGIDEVLGLGR